MIERHYRDLIMARSPEERVLMAVGMFEAARALVLASLPPGLADGERLRRMFRRFYGDLPLARLPPELRGWPT